MLKVEENDPLQGRISNWLSNTKSYIWNHIGLCRLYLCRLEIYYNCGYL